MVHTRPAAAGLFWKKQSECHLVRSAGTDPLIKMPGTKVSKMYRNELKSAQVDVVTECRGLVISCVISANTFITHGAPILMLTPRIFVGVTVQATPSHYVLPTSLVVFFLKIVPTGHKHKT